MSSATELVDCSGRGWLVRLVQHGKSAIERLTQHAGSRRAATKPSGRDKLHLESMPVGGGNDGAATQFYLNRPVQDAVGSNFIEVDHGRVGSVAISGRVGHAQSLLNKFEQRTVYR